MQADNDHPRRGPRSQLVKLAKLPTLPLIVVLLLLALAALYRSDGEIFTSSRQGSGESIVIGVPEEDRCESLDQCSESSEPDLPGAEDQAGAPCAAQQGDCGATAPAATGPAPEDGSAECPDANASPAPSGDPNPVYAGASAPSGQAPPGGC